jgi:hypothetical protein
MQYRSRPSILLFISCGSALLSGCGRTRTGANVQYDLSVGRLAQAQQVIDETYGGSFDAAGKPSADIQQGSRHALLWTLESAQIQRLSGDHARTDAVLETASDKVEELRTRWTTSAKMADIGSWLANDTVLQYEGAGYEHIQVDWMRACSQLLQAQAAEGIYLAHSTTAAVELAQGGGTSSDRARQHYTQAVSYIRHLTEKEPKEVLDASGSRRYYDDPCARLLAGVLMDALPKDLRKFDDLQYADAQFRLAWQSYASQAKAFTGQKSFRYEVGNAPAIARTLLVRNARRYDPAGHAAGLQHIGIDAASVADRPQGHGSLLVVNEVDFISRKEPLTINVAVATIPEFQASWRGTTHNVNIGGFVFWAEGPAAEGIEHWAALPLPGQLTKAVVPGGAAYWRFELPVHAPDSPAPAPQRFVLRPAGELSAAPREITAETASDLDAYARATLKDEQVWTAVKTLTRTVVKQASVSLAAYEAKKRNEWVGLAAQLGGSIAMSLTENADLRGSNLMANRIELAHADLPPGVYCLELAGRRLCALRIVADRTTIVPIRSFPTTVTIPKD